MKKISTLLIAMVLVFEGFSQTYYSWDFTTGTTSAFPTGFTTKNLDGQTVNAQLLVPASQGGIPALSTTAGWIHYPASANGPGAALTCSWFTTATPAADRWLVTPAISVPTATPNVVLEWVAASGDAQAPENYDVLISTTDTAVASFSTVLSVNPENGYNTTHTLPLATNYAGQTIYVAIRNRTVNGYLLILNSIKVLNLPSYSSHIADIEVYEHNYINNPITINGQFTNTGFNTLTDFTVNYSVNGAAPVTSAVTGASIPSQQAFTYAHSVPFSPTTAGTYTIQTWFSALNGTGSNSDTVSTTVFFYPKVSGLVKNVLVEEMTGAGCPWCPGGALALRDAYENHSSYVIPVAIHSADINDMGVSPADAMQIAAGETVIGALCTGFPSAMVDRLYTYDNQSVATGVQDVGGQYGTYQGPGTTYLWDTLSVFRNTMATPVNVSLSVVSFDSTTTTNNLVVTVNADYLNALTQGTYNMNLYVVEDSVLTPAGNNGNGYNQDNANYSGQASSGSSELYSLPATLLDNGQPNEWAHNHVLRAMAGGAWGSTGVIPSAPATGTTYSKTYTLSVPSTWRYNYLYLVGLVQEYNADANKRTVLNATRTKLLSTSTGIKEATNYSNLTVYPNPAATMATVQMDMKSNQMVTLSLVNTLGQTVSAPMDVLMNAGTHSVNIPVGGLDAGLYFVKVSVNGEVNTIPLSVEAK